MYHKLQKSSNVYFQYSTFQSNMILVTQYGFLFFRWKVRAQSTVKEGFTTQRWALLIGLFLQPFIRKALILVQDNLEMFSE